MLGFLPVKTKTYFARTVVSRVVPVTPHLVELWTFCTREETKGVAWPRRRWGCGGRYGVGGAVAEWVRPLACAGDPTVQVGFESHCGELRFRTLAIPFTPIRSVGPLYLVSRPGEVKYPNSPHGNV